MKKILFDLRGCQPNRDSKFHGGGVYGYIVLSTLIEQIADRLVVLYNGKRFIAPEIEKKLKQYNVLTVDVNEKTILQCIEEHNVGAFYSPLFNKSYKQLLNLNIPIVITIHGLRNLEMNRDRTEIYYARSLRDKVKALMKLTPYYNRLRKKYWEEKKWLFEKENVHVVTVSNHSKNSIMYYYPFADEKRIQVMYSVSTTPKDYETTAPYSSEKYYLIVSANRWLKNGYRAIKAFDTLFDNPQYGIEGKVIVLGLSKDTYIYRHIRHKERFELMGYVDQNTLESLYKGAYALVYPTLNEGFGYPPLEAMKYGTPVIASPFASVTEVCGDSVVYANPYSSEEIAFRLLQLEDTNLYREYVKRVLERVSDITSAQEQSLMSLVTFLIQKIETKK